MCMMQIWLDCLIYTLIHNEISRVVSQTIREPSKQSYTQVIEAADQLIYYNDTHG